MNEIITVPAAEYRERMLALRGEGFDFLESFTGMDWGDALGVSAILRRPRRAAASP